MDIERIDNLRSSKIVIYDAFGKQVIPGDIVLYANYNGSLKYDIVKKLVNTGIKVLNDNIILYSKNFIVSTERLDEDMQKALKKKYEEYVDTTEIESKTKYCTFFGAFALSSGYKGFCEFAVKGLSAKDCYERFRSSISLLKNFQFYALCKGKEDGSCIFRKDFSFKEIAVFSKKNTPFFDNSDASRISDKWISKMTEAPIDSPEWKILFWRSMLLVSDEMLPDFNEMNSEFQEILNRPSSPQFYNYTFCRKTDFSDFEKEEMQFIEDECDDKDLMKKDLQFAFWKIPYMKMDPKEEEEYLVDFSQASAYRETYHSRDSLSEFKYLKMFKTIVYLALDIKTANKHKSEFYGSMLFSVDDTIEEKKEKAEAFIKIVKFIKTLEYQV